MTWRLPRSVSDVRADGEAFETWCHDKCRRTIGLRILDRAGWTRMVRVAVAVFWLIYVGLVPTLMRPDLLHPADIGSDTSNYVAAGERLAAGHEVYALEPVDRPVPLDNAPQWTVPLLSPPSIAVMNLWVVALPDGVRLYPTWAIGLAATIALGLLIAALAPPLLLLVAVQLIPGLAITAWSGNVNAVIAPVLVAAWFGVRSPRRWVQAASGAAIAIATGVKIGPVLVAIWLVAQGRRAATIGLLATGAALFGLTTLVAGLSSWVEYFDIAREAAAEPAPLSLPGLLERAGIGGPLAAASIPTMVVAVGVAILAFRHHRAAFALAVVGAVFATSVVRYETLSVAVAAMAPWFGRGLLIQSPAPGDRPRRIARSAKRAVIGGAAIAAAAIVVSIASGGLASSTFRVSNEGPVPVVARLRVDGQPASFGYRVPPRTAVTGWPLLGGQSPPFVTLWTTNCRFIAEFRLPTSGGTVVVGHGTASLTPVVGPEPAAAVLSPLCTAQLKSRPLRR
jgi:hypothetical protein